MIKSLMLIKQYKWRRANKYEDILMFRINCDCGHPEHEWTLEFRRANNIPKYMTLEITSNSSWVYSGLWKRIKMAWSLVRHGTYPQYTDIMLGEDQIIAFKTALKMAEEYMFSDQE